MNTTTHEPAQDPQPASQDATPRDWGIVAFSPCLIGTDSRETAQDHARRDPHCFAVSRAVGEPWPRFDRLDPALMRPEQRTRLLAQLLADPDTRTAALATVDFDDLHAAIITKTEAKLVKCLRDFIQQSVAAGEMSTQPVTHVEFDTADYGSSLRYDEDNACFHHADGTVTAITIEGRAADDWLRDLSELNTDLRGGSRLTVDLTTGTFTYNS